MYKERHFDIFFADLDTVYPFLLSDCGCKDSSTMLNNRGESGHPGLVPDFKGTASSFSPLRTIFAVGFS